MIIDFHAHILPEVDHGCDNLEMANKQIRMAREAGIDLIIATSHYYPYLEDPDSFLDRRWKAYELLCQASTEVSQYVYLGAEVLMFPGLEKLEGLEKLCIQTTKILLLEMPSTPWESAHYKTLKRLREELNLQIVIAHIERYPSKEIDRLAELGFAMQINVKVLTSIWKRRHIKKLVRQGNIVAIGSDIHRLEKGYHKYRRAIKYQRKFINLIMKRTQKMIEGEE